jgi:CHAD domain-containing protein
MAKAAEIDIDPDLPFADAARRIVAVRAEELFAAQEGVLDTQDVERVHAMRVASRRLRAVLEIFAACFEREEHRAVLAEVKALADGLGARRDPDVQLLAVEALAGAMGDAERPGLDVLAGRLRAEQARGNEVLAAALEHADATGLRARLQALAEPAVPAA